MSRNAPELSLLLMSAFSRLVIAGGLIVLIWMSVFWAMSS